MAKIVARLGFSAQKLADYAKGRTVYQDGTFGPWATLGWTFFEPPPEYAVIPDHVLMGWAKDGFAELVDPSPVLRPAGPAHAPWAGAAETGANHQWVHATQVVFHTVEGDYVYDVVANPDKQHPNAAEPGAVENVYLLNLVSAPAGAATTKNPEVPETTTRYGTAKVSYPVDAAEMLGFSHRKPAGS